MQKRKQPQSKRISVLVSVRFTEDELKMIHTLARRINLMRQRPKHYAILISILNKLYTKEIGEFEDWKPIEYDASKAIKGK